MKITSSSPIWPARGLTPSNFCQRTVHGAGIQRHRRQEIDDGRTLRYGMDVTGKMQMPGPDGKMKNMTFKGMGIEDYDNVKKKFVGTWVDNMGTGIMMSEGDYDVATKTSRGDSRDETKEPQSGQDHTQRPPHLRVVGGPRRE
jgi:hypothetical protein